jgi:hypothetical protein
MGSKVVFAVGDPGEIKPGERDERVARVLPVVPAIITAASLSSIARVSFALTSGSLSR